jgi:hypothetical protein
MNGDELDRILDDALSSYSLAEPRPGLAQRVMARVQTERTATRVPWWLAGFAALACTAIAMMMWPSRTPAPPVAITKSVVPRIVGPPTDVPRHELAQPRVFRTRHLPRRETLPSASPLTQEELTLLAFAQQAPGAALQFAQLDKPLEIEPITIRPLEIDGPSTGENQ